MGALKLFKLGRENGVAKELRNIWEGKTTKIEKVNSIAVDAKRIAIGGLSKDGKGFIELWTPLTPSINTNNEL